MPIFVLLVLVGAALLWLLLSFGFIPIGKLSNRLLKDASDESKEGENYAFAYNLAPDGMSREGGFNIIIAEVPMEKDEDTHNNCVTSLKNLGFCIGRIFHFH